MKKTIMVMLAVLLAAGMAGCITITPVVQTSATTSSSTTTATMPAATKPDLKSGYKRQVWETMDCGALFQVPETWVRYKKNVFFPSTEEPDVWVFNYEPYDMAGKTLEDDRLLEAINETYSNKEEGYTDFYAVETGYSDKGTYYIRIGDSDQRGYIFSYTKTDDDGKQKEYVDFYVDHPDGIIIFELVTPKGRASEFIDEFYDVVLSLYW